jgi:hypothetical protein
VDSNLSLNTAAIAALESGDPQQIGNLSMPQRAELLSLACRSAARIEASRKEMGLPPAEPAPWPPSTWAFLAQCASRAKQQLGVAATNRDLWR